MSNSSGINSRNHHLTVLQPLDHHTVGLVRQPVVPVHTKIERGIKLNPMQKNFLEKFENMRRDALDPSAELGTDAKAVTGVPTRRGLFTVEKISKK